MMPTGRPLPLARIRTPLPFLANTPTVRRPDGAFGCRKPPPSPPLLDFPQHPDVTRCFYRQSHATRAGNGNSLPTGTFAELIDGDRDHLDPYCLPVQIADFDLERFAAGEHLHLERVLGAQPIRQYGHSGTLFTVWAPTPHRCRSSAIGTIGKSPAPDAPTPFRVASGNCFSPMSRPAPPINSASAMPMGDIPPSVTHTRGSSS